MDAGLDKYPEYLGNHQRITEIFLSILYGAVISVLTAYFISSRLFGPLSGLILILGFLFFLTSDWFGRIQLPIRVSAAAAPFHYIYKTYLDLISICILLFGFLYIIRDLSERLTWGNISVNVYLIFSAYAILSGIWNRVTIFDIYSWKKLVASAFMGRIQDEEEILGRFKKIRNWRDKVFEILRKELNNIIQRVGKELGKRPLELAALGRVAGQSVKSFLKLLPKLLALIGYPQTFLYFLALHVSVFNFIIGILLLFSFKFMFQNLLITILPGSLFFWIVASLLMVFVGAPCLFAAGCNKIAIRVLFLSMIVFYILVNPAILVGVLMIQQTASCIFFNALLSPFGKPSTG